MIEAPFVSDRNTILRRSGLFKRAQISGMRGVHVRMRGAHRCMTGITCYKTSNAVVVEEICDKGGYKSACKPKMLSARLGIKRQLRLSLASLGRMLSLFRVSVAVEKVPFCYNLCMCVRN